MTIFQRGVARGGGGRGGQSFPGNWKISKPYSHQGGRLCPSHYCQPPWIQKAIYTSGYSACWEPRRVCDNSVANSSFI